MTKAGITWKCRFDASFWGGMAHDCGDLIGPNECSNKKSCDAECHLCIPAAEARGPLNRLVDETEAGADYARRYEKEERITYKAHAPNNMRMPNKSEWEDLKLNTWARALLAKLPEEE